jgi:hypothetical protein
LVKNIFGSTTSVFVDGERDCIICNAIHSKQSGADFFYEKLKKNCICWNVFLHKKFTALKKKYMKGAKLRDI